MDYLKLLLKHVVKFLEAGTVETLLEHQVETREAAVGVDDSESCQIEAMMFGEEGIEEVALLLPC